MARKKKKETPKDRATDAAREQDAPEAESNVASEQQIVAGDPDLYQSLQDPHTSAHETMQVDEDRSSAAPVSRIPYFTHLQKVLILGILLVTVLLGYAVLKTPKTSNARPASPAPPVYATNDVPDRQPTESPAMTVSAREDEEENPISIKTARDFSLNQDYGQAYGVYEQLMENLPNTPQEDLLKDFLNLQMALCLMRMEDLEQAGRILSTMSRSRSPVVRILANYHLCRLDLQQKHYLGARRRAYQALGMIHVIEEQRDWVRRLRTHCHFLAAQASTRMACMLYDVDTELPVVLWQESHLDFDPFFNLEETRLRTFLTLGVDPLDQALITPRIQQIDSDKARRWRLICHRASIDEVLARIAANTALDVRWSDTANKSIYRKRAVSLYLQGTGVPQMMRVAAGCTGLLAHTDQEGVTHIVNPEESSLISEQASLLAQESISLWQRLLLSAEDERYFPTAHFALGVLQAKAGNISEAIAEYQLVVSRFSRSELAPYALFASSRLKKNLHDYTGMNEDLKQLVEVYPDSAIVGQAFLALADTIGRTGDNTDAARLYRKVYYLNVSPESRAAAAFSAGKSFYELKDYASAEKWLTQYLELVQDRRDAYLPEAYFLLGESLLGQGKVKTAGKALQQALSRPLSPENHAKALSSMITCCIRLEDFVQALDVLESAYVSQLSQRESADILLLESRVLRAMGLTNQAIDLLLERTQYFSEPLLKARISLELSDCYIESHDFGPAQKQLAETLALTDSADLAHEIALKLARVCLSLDRQDQTVSVCREILDQNPSDDISKQAFTLLARAYDRGQEYNKAALALMGQWQ